MKNNIIEVKHKRDSLGRFGFEEINIDMKNVSYGALTLLQRELEREVERNKEADHPVWQMYCDMCNEIQNKLKEKLGIEPNE